jgi:hypothetical protein
VQHVVDVRLFRRGHMKTVQNLRNSLKFKAPVVENALAVVIDGTAHVIRDAEVRLLAGSEFAFVSAPSFSHIVRIGGDQILYPLNDAEPAEAAERELKDLLPKKERKKREGGAELPEELRAALLQSIPKGYRLQADADGNVRLVKTRNRRGADDSDTKDEEES